MNVQKEWKRKHKSAPEYVFPGSSPKKVSVDDEFVQDIKRSKSLYETNDFYLFQRYAINTHPLAAEQPYIRRQIKATADPNHVNSIRKPFTVGSFSPRAPSYARYINLNENGTARCCGPDSSKGFASHVLYKQGVREGVFYKNKERFIKGGEWGGRRAAADARGARYPRHVRRSDLCRDAVINQSASHKAPGDIVRPRLPSAAATRTRPIESGGP
ncbi:hypothetical protein EVAR_76614_1 [Eumeta japonica]|uniref:Uncharacterized protein n=1 Tax=Eumeta variegata TaxID=151549 RepID=A0A4C1T673_EUMVA|nr:hypothetical protein EVAR_76614_1 [Eumeta japonica]